MNIRDIVFWTLDAVKGGGKYKKEIQKVEHELSSNTPASEKIAAHNTRLQKILNHASQNVPFYKNRYGKDLPLDAYPVTSKELIKRNLDQFISQGIDKTNLMSRYTSGSTGSPFHFYFGPEKIFHNHISLLFHNIENGYDIGDRMFYFRAWNGGNRYSKFHMLKNNLEMQDCQVSEENVARLLGKLKKTTNNVFWGYSSAVIAYAKKIQKGATGNSVKVIYTSSDLLSDTDRAYVADIFGCPTFSRYSDEEIGVIAQQYSMSSPKFRINTPMVHVEILKLDSDKPADPDELGRVIITDLTNKSMPFIRYDTGDLSTFSDGDKTDGVLFYMNNIQGRSLDYLTTSSGEQVPGLKINNLAFWKEDSVYTYQFIQETDASYRMMIIPKDNFSDDKLLVELHSLLGNNAEIQIERVRDIPLTKSGKRRYIINNTLEN